MSDAVDTGDDLDCLDISQLSSMSFVYISKCHPRSLHATAWNIATSQPGNGVMECISPEGLGSESSGNGGPGGSGFPHENFRLFHLLLKK